MKKFYYIRLTIAGIILLLSILAVCGIFYPVKFLDVQFTPLLGRVICDFSLLFHSLAFSAVCVYPSEQ